MPPATPFGFTSLFGSLTAVSVMVYLTAVFSQHVGKKGGFQVHHEKHDETPVNHADGRESDALRPLLDDDTVDDFLDYGLDDGLDNGNATYY
jgi:hypothetical protein